MKVALAQLSPEGNLERDSDNACSVIHSHGNADLIVFPELFLGGYETDAPGTVATETEGEAMRRIGRACSAAGTAALVGFTEARPDRAFANSAACFDRDGKLKAVYRKANLFGDAEKSAFEAGEAMILTTLGSTVIGPQICFDVEFPEPSRLMAVAGAQLLATLSANMEPYAADHRLAARARALDNRLPHLYVNRVGEQSGHRFTGESCVIGPDGTVLAELARQEAVLEFEFEAKAPAADISYLNQLRSDLEVIVQVNANGGEA